MAAANPDREAICERILIGVEAGKETLADLCRAESIGRTTFYDWLKNEPELSERFVRARESGFDNLADDTIRIADEPSKTKLDAADKRIRIDTRLKLLSKWDPKRYGERTTIAGDPEAPLTTPADPAAAAIAMASILAAARQRKDNDGSDLA